VKIAAHAKGISPFALSVSIQKKLKIFLYAIFAPRMN
jgi:hypothetical protein